MEKEHKKVGKRYKKGDWNRLASAIEIVVDTLEYYMEVEVQKFE